MFPLVLNQNYNLGVVQTIHMQLTQQEWTIFVYFSLNKCGAIFLFSIWKKSKYLTIHTVKKAKQKKTKLE